MLLFWLSLLLYVAHECVGMPADSGCTCEVTKTHKITDTTTSTYITTVSDLDEVIITYTGTETYSYYYFSYITATAHATSTLEYTGTGYHTVTVSHSGSTTLSVCESKGTPAGDVAIAAKPTPCTCSITSTITSTTTKLVLDVLSSSTTSYDQAEYLTEAAYDGVDEGTTTVIFTTTLVSYVSPLSYLTYTSTKYASTSTVTLPPFKSPDSFILQVESSNDPSLNGLYIWEELFIVDYQGSDWETACLSVTASVADAPPFHLANRTVLRIPSHKSTCQAYYNGEMIVCPPFSNPPAINPGYSQELGGCSIDCFGVFTCNFEGQADWNMVTNAGEFGTAECLSIVDFGCHDPLCYSNQPEALVLKVLPALVD